MSRSVLPRSASDKPNGSSKSWLAVASRSMVISREIMQIEKRASRDRTNENARSLLSGRFDINSLTMSYFHTGIRTIIGAEAFHCPVRDGKEWFHLAMVIRLDRLLSTLKGKQPIHRVNQQILGLRPNRHNGSGSITIKVIGSSRTSN